MTETNSPADAAADELQFTVVEPAAPTGGAGAATPSASSCVLCRKPIVDRYYSIRGKVVCPGCRQGYDAAISGGSKAGRLLKASAFGLGAGLLGAVLWYAVRKATGYEIGLIAVAVGFMVGRAVLRGSGNRGGRGYQVVAVVLTYCSIASTYMPDVVQMMLKEADKTSQPAVSHKAAPNASARSSQPEAGADASAPADSSSHTPTPSTRPPPSAARAIVGLVVLIVMVFAISLAVPFLGGAQNLIGLLIIGFALWEAWKINRSRRIDWQGPFTVGAGALPAGAVA